MAREYTSLLLVCFALSLIVVVGGVLLFEHEGSIETDTWATGPRPQRAVPYQAGAGLNGDVCFDLRFNQFAVRKGGRRQVVTIYGPRPPSGLVVYGRLSTWDGYFPGPDGWHGIYRDRYEPAGEAPEAVTVVIRIRRGYEDLGRLPKRFLTWRNRRISPRFVLAEGSILAQYKRRRHSLDFGPEGPGHVAILRRGPLSWSLEPLVRGEGEVNKMLVSGDGGRIAIQMTIPNEGEDGREASPVTKVYRSTDGSNIATLHGFGLCDISDDGSAMIGENDDRLQVYRDGKIRQRTFGNKQQHYCFGSLSRNGAYATMRHTERDLVGVMDTRTSAIQCTVGPPSSDLDSGGSVVSSTGLLAVNWSPRSGRTPGAQQMWVYGADGMVLARRRLKWSEGDAGRFVTPLAWSGDGKVLYYSAFGVLMKMAFE